MSCFARLKSLGMTNSEVSYSDVSTRPAREIGFALCHCGHVEKNIRKDNCVCGHALKWQSAVASIAQKKMDKHKKVTY